MSNSKLATYTNISPNKNHPRNHAIDTITIHCFVGQVTAKRGCEVFASKSRQASCNYVIGKDGDIGLCVDECDRSWCSSNKYNDHRAITIEVASDTSHPYAVTPAAYSALLDLVTDICKRNDIKKLVWSNSKSDRVNHRNGCNMTAHRDYANKSCPGEWLYSREGEIAKEVNRRLAPAKSVSEVATEVIRGEWGNGADRKNRLTAAGYDYDEVQAEVKRQLNGSAPAPKPKPAPTPKPTPKPQHKIASAKSFSKGVAGKYKVVSSTGWLRLRSGPSTSYAELEKMPAGSVAQCYGYYTGDWLLVVSASNTTGYCSKSYLTKL